jgi:ATP-dependent Clp protease ATP-binding subunit ClpA
MKPFDAYLHAVIMRAEHEAREDGSASIEAQHLLLAIIAEPEPSLRPVLDAVGLDRDAARGALDREFAHSLGVVGVSPDAHALPRPSRLPTHPNMGTSLKLALDRGFAGAARKKDLRPAHVLLGVLAAEVGTVPRALAMAGFDRADLLARTRRALTTDTD